MRTSQRFATIADYIESLTFSTIVFAIAKANLNLQQLLRLLGGGAQPVGKVGSAKGLAGGFFFQI